MNHTHTDPRLECARRLRLVCRRLSLTQADMARLTGRSRAVVSNYLSGRLAPSFQVMQRLGEVLRLDMNWVYFGEGSMFRSGPQAQAGEMLRRLAAPSRFPEFRLAEPLAEYVPGASGQSRAADDSADRPKGTAEPAPLRSGGPESPPHSACEAVVSQTPLDVHRGLLRIVGNVCDILAASGVEDEVINHVEAELIKISVEPLVR